MSRLRGITLLFLAGLFLLALREHTLRSPGTTIVHIFDVGQGDAAMIETPSGRHVLIDGGPDLSLLEHLGTALSFFDRTIDLLILTHPDLDHIAAFPDILRRFRVRHVLLTGIGHNLGRYDLFFGELQKNKTPLTTPDERYDIDIGDGVSLDILWPAKTTPLPAQGNNSSIVFRLLLHGLPCLLFTGDIEEKAEHAILRSGSDISAAVIKVPHHGSKTSSSTGFLLAADPALAIISVGSENRFGHPHPEVVSRYARLGIPVRQTGRDGTVTLRFTAKKGNGTCSFVVD